MNHDGTNCTYIAHRKVREIDCTKTPAKTVLKHPTHIKLAMKIE